MRKILKMPKTEAVSQRYSVKRVFSEIYQNSHETTVPESFFCSLRPAIWLKKILWNRCFPANFAKFLRTPFLKNTSGGYFFQENLSLLEIPKNIFTFANKKLYCRKLSAYISLNICVFVISK